MHIPLRENSKELAVGWELQLIIGLSQERCIQAKVTISSCQWLILQNVYNRCSFQGEAEWLKCLFASGNME